ncbi:MAG: ArsR/SmtB family transcription factor [Pseudonocardiaceae bacterium]
MSRQLPTTVPVACFSPLTRDPLTVDQSVEMARRFKALGDPVRLRLLSLIASHAGGEACVCELTGAFEVSGPTISHHLKVLRTAGLVEAERRGTWIYYRAQSDALRALSAALLPSPART